MDYFTKYVCWLAVFLNFIHDKKAWKPVKLFSGGGGGGGGGDYASAWKNELQL